MEIGFLLLLLAGGALLVPLFGGDDDDEGTDDQSQIDGTFENDQLEGTEGNDLIRGFLGDDTINGNGGDDEIRPGEGADIVDGGAGDDNILGSPGADTLSGGDGYDRIFGGADDDEIDGGADADFIAGGDGNDLIFGGQGTTGANPERDPEFIRGDDGDDTIFIWGEGGEVRGNADDDELILMTGDATMEAGGGLNDDFYVMANVSDAQLTEATITDFDPERDTLTLTIDYVADGGTPPDVDVTLTETTVDGISGVRIDAVFVGPGDIPVSSEASSAFVQGATIAQLGSANIEVVLTEEADLDDPVGLLNDVIAARPVVPA
ncbi:hemolysin type calcium-binding protein [Loktanella sp. PT4BL]|jgi:Ca2+-binding RTX toxin-like protein|uniref:calcium-binding protein n=1 Tax=Loktanella sp. PT4BL TaxID=2135611 RepID=UPI000D7741A7|nr:calcium-binding protein [Loktanella sp. PT4BL]PXW68801.1 hemolysin type calcium-binding protein [Loktanella sp. PT4BL]